ncbi:MAG TPA: rhomboid family intramembrane serine protease [Streptosporangiaceae bacterium]|jgi:membrane associated rhomboid family serine protease
MRDASVGFQCPECVQEGNRGGRRPRRFALRSSTAYVTWTLVGLNVLVFIGQLVDRGLEASGELVPILVADGEWWRLITSAFLHAPGTIPLHILFNMWALIVLGPQLEQALGRLRFTAVYFLSALAGSALVMWVSGIADPTIGASGAIFGLFGAIFVMARRLRLDTTWLVIIIVLNLVMTFTISGISWGAHVGGLLAGAALALVYVYAPVRRQRLVEIGGTAALAVVIAAAVLIRISVIDALIPGL